MNKELYKSSKLEDIKASISQWLKNVCYKPGYYRYSQHAYRPYSVESSSQAVGVLWEIGEFQKFPPEEVAEHIQALQSFQKENGEFYDPLLNESHRLNKKHPWVKVNEHIAGVCKQSLATCGSAPLYKDTTQPIFDVSKLDPDEWINSLDHRETPWGRCHNVAFSLLAYRQENNLITEMDVKTKRIYELIESQMINPADGMPGAVDHSIGRRIAGYYMFTFCYLPFGMALPNPEKAIDLIIKAVNPDGQIGEGGMCQNWDAIYTLNHVCRQLNWNYRHDEVVDLAQTVYDFLLRVHRKADGGFSFFPDLCQQEHNAISVAPAYAESDMQGTLMAMACLNICKCLKMKQYHRTFLAPFAELK